MENAAADQATTASTETDVGALEQTTEQPTALESAPTDDYSYVPEKFVIDGKPDFEKLASSYSELEATMRKTRPAAPKDASEYEYEWKTEIDEERTNAFKAEAKDMGLSVDQYQWLMGKYEDAMMSSVVTADKAREALSAEWGDQFDTNLAAAKSAWTAFADDDLDISAIGNNATALKLLAKIGREMGEDKPINATASNATTYTRLEIDEMMQSKDYTMNKEKQRIVTEWFQAAYPD